MASPVLYFATADLANQLVAGVPAVARAVSELADKGKFGEPKEVLVAIPDGCHLSDWSEQEMARLVPGIGVDCVKFEQINDAAVPTVWDGVDLVGQGNADLKRVSEIPPTDDHKSRKQQLIVAGNAIIKGTAKPSDGVVSRYLNRPVSQFISKLWLRREGVMPIHATVLAALIGVVMSICLLTGTQAGLIAGAILFHAASVIDGVDGEIARATKRSSDFGAKLDTICDGITNLAFLLFTSVNLWMQGEVRSAMTGGLGLLILAIGLTALGLRSRAQGGPFTFDAVKNEFRGKPSRFTRALAAITSRDVYAAAFALFVAIGFAPEMLLFFAAAVSVWLVTILAVLFRTRKR